MVCIDLTIVNETDWPVEETMASQHYALFMGKRRGTLSCPAHGQSVVYLRPEPGFLGVEKGIEYLFCILAGEGQWPISVTLDFPAVGADHWSRPLARMCA